MFLTRYYHELELLKCTSVGTPPSSNSTQFTYLSSRKHGVPRVGLLALGRYSNIKLVVFAVLLLFLCQSKKK